MTALPETAGPPPTKTFRILSALLGVLMGLFFGLMLLYSFTATGELRLLTFFFLPPAALALFNLCRSPGPAALPPQLKYAAIACGVVFLLAAQVRFAAAIYGNILYDFNNVYTAAQGLALNGTLGGQEDYFAMFPNNLLLMLLFAAAIKLSALLGIANTMAVLTAGSMAAVDLSILFTCLCARKLWGPRAPWPVLFFGIPLCVLHYGIVCPYSDTFGMLFLTSLLTLYLHMPQKTRPALAVSGLMGLLALLGYKIKPQTIIILLAAALAELFFARLTKARLLHLGKRLLCFILGVILAATAFGAIAQAATGRFLPAGMKEKREIPFTHFLMMGCNAETLGKYNTEDYEATLSHETKREKIQYNLQTTVQRLKAMGPAGYASFLAEKGRTVFASIYMGMWVARPFCRADPLSTALQETFCEGGSAFPVYLQFQQALWVLLLLLWLLPLILCPQSFRNKPGTVLRLEIMGYTAFQLLFETGARYRFHQLPVFILLGVWGLTLLPGGLRDTCHRVKALLPALKKAEP